MAKGYSWHKQHDMWEVRFRGRYLGLFYKEEDAAEVYARAKETYEKEGRMLSLSDFRPGLDDDYDAFSYPLR